MHYYSRELPFIAFNFLSRLVQIRIQLLETLPVQVDGEPWNQPPGHVVVLRSALKVQQPPHLSDNFQGPYPPPPIPGPLLKKKVKKKAVVWISYFAFPSFRIPCWPDCSIWYFQDNVTLEIIPRNFILWDRCQKWYPFLAMSAIAISSAGTEPYKVLVILFVVGIIWELPKYWEKSSRHFTIKYSNVPFRQLCSRSRRTRSRGGSRKPASTFLTTLTCTRSPRALTATVLEPVNDTVASKYSKTSSVRPLYYWDVTSILDQKRVVLKFTVFNIPLSGYLF